MEDDNTTLQESYYKQAVDNLENFLITIKEHAQDNQDVQQAYNECPESVKKGRSLEALAVDEISNIFAALTYNGKNRAVLYKYYRALRNLFKDSDEPALSEKEASDELKQHYAELDDAEIDYIQETPHFLEVLVSNISLDDAADLANSWEQTLQDMLCCAQDKNGIAVMHRYETLLTNHLKGVQRIFKENHAVESVDAPFNQPDPESGDDGEQDEHDPYAQNGLPRPGDVPVIVQQGLQTKQQIQILKYIREEYNQHIDAVNQQLKELGEDVDLNSDFAELKYKLENLPLPDEVRKKADDELKKLEDLSQQDPEYKRSMTYLEKLASWPWGQHSEVTADTGYTREILDADHYGLEPVKERILEQVAVQNRTSDGRPPMICLVGPPGVGKTSIAGSLAQAMNREFVKMSLGGIRDESDIRGHKSTYVGAIPGRIVEEISKAGADNPLFLMDEIDKIPSGGGPQGDAEAALLEVLDPEQNSAFRDHYLQVGLDLSQVMFVMTANDKSNIPEPLKDRMEIIDLDPYVTEEKLQIGKRYLTARQKREKGVENTGLTISDDAMRDIIVNYAPEAGVRRLEREIGRICAQHAKAIEEGVVAEDTPVEITPDNLEDYLGPTALKQEVKDHKVEKGVVHGLAASNSGGSVLEIKATRKPDNSKGFQLDTTAEGEIGGMMERSAKVASAYIQSHHEELGISAEDIQNTNLHVHVLDGGSGVDGPSAGAAFTTTILSAAVADVKGMEVRSDVAMTGTVDPHGKVGAIGGLKQKLDAARNNPNITTVLIPKQNEGDLRNVPQPIKDALTIVPVRTIDEVLSHALHNDQPAPVNDDKPDGGSQGGMQSAPACGGRESGCATASLSRLANVPFRSNVPQTGQAGQPVTRAQRIRPLAGKPCDGPA